MKTSIKFFNFILVLFLLCSCSNAKSVKNTVKSQGNPVIAHLSTADPAVMVYKNKIYLYASEDIPASNLREPARQSWVVFSSPDMETWTEYPIPLKKNTFKWALDNDEAWASHVVERDGKFYWYASIGSFSSRPKTIGVAVSDSPTGPFVDAIGKPLITSKIAPSYIKWGDVDPCVFIDDDGQAYLFWGGGQCFYAKLKDNMVELEGEAHAIDLPMYWTGPWVHKYKKKYYLSYGQRSSPFMIGYAMSDNIVGPWEYVGIMSNNVENDITYQGAITEFKGKWYYFYHRGFPDSNGTLNRKICIDRLDYSKDGTIQKVKMTEKGIFGK